MTTRDHDDFKTKVGSALRARRIRNGLTQSALAKEAGLSPNYVARLERGEMGPSLFVADALCIALGTTIDTILREAA